MRKNLAFRDLRLSRLGSLRSGPPPVATAITFGARTLVGAGARSIAAANGTYGPYTVSGGMVSPNTTPVTPGTYDVGGATVTAVADEYSVQSIAEHTAAMADIPDAGGRTVRFRAKNYDWGGSFTYIAGARAFTSPVVITCEPGAQIGQMTAIYRCQNLILRGLKFKWLGAPPAVGVPMLATDELGPNNIIEDCEFEGIVYTSLDVSQPWDAPVDPIWKNAAQAIRGSAGGPLSAGLTIRRCNIHDVTEGIVMEWASANPLLVEDCEIHHTFSDPMKFTVWGAGLTAQKTWQRIVCHSFLNSIMDNDVHGDVLQFIGTVNNHNQLMENVTIRQIVAYMTPDSRSGQIGGDIQGITNFTDGGYRVILKDPVIAGNFMALDGNHHLTVRLDGGVVANNTFIHPNPTWPKTGSPRITLLESTGTILVKNNIYEAAGFFEPGTTNMVDNVVIGVKGATNAFSTVFDGPTFAPATLAEYKSVYDMKVGGPADIGDGAGAFGSGYGTYGGPRDSTGWTFDPDREGPGGVPQTPANFSNVNADGWSVDYTSPPTFNPAGSPEYFTVTRAGFNASGTAITFDEDLICTQRIRQPYPNHASLTTDQVAVSDYIYSTDVVVGATNGSTEASPKPVANWALPDQQLVGNTVHLEVVAFHRDGRGGEQVAAVEFRATDGTTTVTQVVSASSILGHSGDRFPVIGYACDLDVSTLANPATITVNAKVFPFVGGASSVLNSSDNSGLRAFAPLKFRRDTAIFAAPRYAYVNVSTGNDTTGAVSTTAATAKASPCATKAGAMNRAVAIYGTCDGLIIRLMAGSQSFVTSAIASTRALSEGAEVIIERDPDSARSACISYLQAGGSRPRLGASGGQLRWRDVTVQRQSALWSMYGEVASHLSMVFESCDFDNASSSGTIYEQYCSGKFLGTTITNAVSGFTAANATYHHLMWRGVQMGGGGNIEAWLMLGSDFTSINQPFLGSKAQSGVIGAFNRFRGYTNGYTFSNVPGGAATVQNIWECTLTSATSTMQFADGGPLTHIIVQHNVVTGFFNVGRNNLFYDQTSAPATSKLMSVRGNIHGQLNTKGDRFDSNGALLGNWAYLYGVGCYGEFSMFIDANSSGIGGSFAQAYPGLGAKIGTSSTVRQDPLFVDYKGVTSGPTAGAGGGNYALQSGSPAKAMLTKPALKYDMAGAARSLTAASAGAYE